MKFPSCIEISDSEKYLLFFKCHLRKHPDKYKLLRSIASLHKHYFQLDGWYSEAEAVITVQASALVTVFLKKL